MKSLTLLLIVFLSLPVWAHDPTLLSTQTFVQVIDDSTMQLILNDTSQTLFVIDSAFGNGMVFHATPRFDTAGNITGLLIIIFETDWHKYNVERLGVVGVIGNDSLYDYKVDISDLLYLVDYMFGVPND